MLPQDETRLQVTLVIDGCHHLVKRRAMGERFGVQKSESGAFRLWGTTHQVADAYQVVRRRTVVDFTF
jgi:hypothetical protein